MKWNLFLRCLWNLQIFLQNNFYIFSRYFVYILVHLSIWIIHFLCRMYVRIKWTEKYVIIICFMYQIFLIFPLHYSFHHKTHNMNISIKFLYEIRASWIHNFPRIKTSYGTAHDWKRYLSFLTVQWRWNIE